MRNFKNFTSTVADWIQCEVPETPPDFVSFCGSAYWDYGDRVRRLSDHWGQLRNSKWLLNGKESNIYCCAECFYEDFRSLRCLLEDETQWPTKESEEEDMKINDELKDNVKKDLSKTGVHTLNYKENDYYVSATITYKERKYKLVWERADRVGNLIDLKKKECDSFDELWGYMQQF